MAAEWFQGVPGSVSQGNAFGKMAAELVGVVLDLT